MISSGYYLSMTREDDYILVIILSKSSPDRQLVNYISKYYETVWAIKLQRE